MAEDWSRIAALAAIRDQSHADVERAIAAIEHLEPGITPDSVKRFASAARLGKTRAFHKQAINQALKFPEQSALFQDSPK